MKTIIVAVDFSPAARKAFRFAVLLARQWKGKVIAVYVINTTDLRFALREDIAEELGSSKELKERVQRYVNQKFKDLEKLAGGYKKVQMVSVHGAPYLEITRLARKYSSDLVVTGTRSRPTAAELILGSTARELIRNSPCPVVTLRADTRVR